METSWKRRVFRNEPIKRFANDNGGIYIIYKDNEIIFIGESYNLKEEFLLLLSGMKGIMLSFFKRNGLNFSPHAVVNQLLLLYIQNHGRMPELNKRALIHKSFSCNQ